jgi:hypothetical protein
MTGFDEAMAALGAEEREEVAPLRHELMRRAREVFENFYPKLTPDEIRQDLETHTAFSELEIEIIESFYATTSYSRTARELQLHPSNPQAKIRHTVLMAVTRLPDGSHLRTALQMAYAHRNIREEPAGG